MPPLTAFMSQIFKDYQNTFNEVNHKTSIGKCNYYNVSGIFTQCL